MLQRILKAPRYAYRSTAGFVRTRPPVWDLLNRHGLTLYKQQRRNLDESQRQLVSTIGRDGLATTDLSRMLPAQDALDSLNAYVAAREAETTVGTRKTFLRYLGGDLSTATPILDLDNPFVRLSLDPRILDVVNAYIGTCAKLIYYEVAITNVMDAGAAAIGSQRWHRDPGMGRLIKMFVYLSDVDEHSGPFMFVNGSHSTGRLGNFYPQKHFGSGGRYPPEGAVEKAVPPDDVVSCVGPPGTVLLCDTTGLHRGGYSRRRARTMFTAVYAAEADTLQPKFIVQDDAISRMRELDPVARFAVT